MQYQSPGTTTIQDLSPLTSATLQPRAFGAMRLAVKPRAGRTVIDRLHQQGSLKALFPHGSTPGLTAVLLNTAGGITGGDRFDQRLSAPVDTSLTVTTQAAERVYRALSGRGRVCTGLRIGPNARLDWLPQETILYDRSALSRRLDVTLESGATCLLVESLIFGRRAMGEVLRQIDLEDRITICRDGQLVFADRTRLNGDVQVHLNRSATGQGAGAMASLIFTAPGAGDKLEQARDILRGAAGISQPAPDLLFARLLAEDGFALRATLIPLIAAFRDAPLPRPWMI